MITATNIVTATTNVITSTNMITAINMITIFFSMLEERTTSTIALARLQWNLILYSTLHSRVENFVMIQNVL